eukprot:TsM_000931200 transcript=TsM_000931200 gene=TsM_000931200
MLTGRETRVSSNTFLPSKEAATDNVPEHVPSLNGGIGKAFNMACRHLQATYSGKKKYYDKHSRTNTYRAVDLVQIYKPIPSPERRDPFRVVKVLSPTNYLVRNAELCTQPITVQHNKMRPYQVVSPVGYEDEVCEIEEGRKLPDGTTKANGRE